jgi:hypothetical protein
MTGTRNRFPLDAAVRKIFGSSQASGALMFCPPGLRLWQINRFKFVNEKRGKQRSRAPAVESDVTPERALPRAGAARIVNVLKLLRGHWERQGDGLRSEEERARRAEARRGRVMGPEVGSEKGKQPAPAKNLAARNPRGVGFPEVRGSSVTPPKRRSLSNPSSQSGKVLFAPATKEGVAL